MLFQIGNEYWSIGRLFENIKTIALVGASPRGPSRASWRVMQFLQLQGYKVYPDLSSALKENSQTLDWVLSSQVIEHVESPIEFLKEIYELLKPGGQAIIITPNRKDILINLLVS